MKIIAQNMKRMYKLNLKKMKRITIGVFTVMDGSEAEGDLCFDTNLPALLCKSSYSYAN